ncbi:MAG: YlbF family regulator [Lachnospiraceae bacterium]|nr:YlbF family regulator [Lachnospiraceae bacterium]
MTEVDNELHVLIEAVRHSETYKQYDRKRVALKSNPELKQKVDVYRAENYRLQNLPDDGTLQDRIEAFAEANMELSEEPMVREFLDAELGLCRMLQEVVDRVVRAIDFE